MEQRRLLLFFVSAMAILLVWTKFLAPIFFGVPNRQAGQQVAQDKADDQQAPDKQDDQPARDQNDELPPGEQPLQADKPANDNEPPPNAGDRGDDQQPPAEVPQIADDWDPAQIEHQTVRLGSLDESTGYFMEVDLTSQGAGVLELRLSDPRYVRLDDTNKPLELIQSNNQIPPTLATVFYAKEQEEVGLADLPGLIEWQIAKDEQGNELKVEDPKHPGIFQSVTFRGVFPDLGIEVLKTFSLKPSDKQKEDELKEARRTELSGYQLELGIQIRNLTSKPQDVLYHLQGPVGVPVEGQENTRMMQQRQIAVGFLQPDETVDNEVLRAQDLIKQIDNKRTDLWTGALRYIGIDVKYFATLLVPVQDQNKDQIYATSFPMLVERNNDPELSDISVVLQSRKFNLLASGGKFPDGEPADVVSHQIKLFAGPKRDKLLTPMGADSILSYGSWFGFLVRGMLRVLNGLHWMGIPYGIAIIILTIMVRSCLYPLSRKQAIGAKKMKELQPKLQEIKKKYAKDKEKQARAQMELFRKHNYNPLAGCLPLLLQFPIFISLYRALGSSVDLRLASFLWIDNLAAPDHLFTLPFPLPILGQQFNLLPILTVVLFIAQMKLFQPPAQTEEQRLQYKMMSVMPVVMGVLFYSVPAGLCLYFIASSLWGMAERKILDFGKPPEQQQPATEKKAKVKA